MARLFLLCAILALMLLTGFASVQKGTSLSPGDPSAPSQVTPRQALETARLFSTYPWRPFARNIKHGLDPVGVRVETPDAGYRPESGRNGWWIPGQVNEGI